VLGSRFLSFVTIVVLTFLFLFAGRVWAETTSKGLRGVERPNSGRYETASVTSGISSGGDIELDPLHRKLIGDVVALLEKHFVDPVSPLLVLQTALKRLSLTFLPICTESVKSLSDCPGNPEECFVDAIETMSCACNLDPGRLSETALRGVLHELDKNASLLDATMQQELTISVSGRFGGVGMVVAPRNGDYAVVAPFDGSPAYKAGIRTGDTILEIDGRSLHGLPLADVLSLVRGPAGSVVRFTVRNSQTGTVSVMRVKRQTIRIAPVRSLLLENEIVYLRIVNFQNGTAVQVRKALSRMLARNPRLKGLILDVRDNPGGLLEEAVMVAGLFVSSGVITSVRGRDKGSERKILANSSSTFPGLPMVILINKGSASGSEVLVGALQGRPNVLVLGERSFGKASVQAVFPLENGFALRLTTAHYYTSDGRNIDGVGLEPDVTMVSPEVMAQEKLGFSKPEELLRDAAIRKALSYLQKEGPLPRSPFPNWF